MGKLPLYIEFRRIYIQSHYPWTLPDCTRGDRNAILLWCHASDRDTIISKRNYNSIISIICTWGNGNIIIIWEISFWLKPLFTTLIRLKFSITSTPNVMMSLRCMTSSSHTLRLFIGRFRRKYQKYSRTPVWIWLLCFKYLLYFVIVLFWFRYSESYSGIWYILQIHFTIEETLVSWPQLLRKFKFLIYHHGGQLIATYSFVSYYIVRSLIQPQRPRFPIYRLFCTIHCRPCRVHPGICGEGRFGEFGNWPRNLGEGRGPRSLSDGEQYPHVCRLRRSSRVSTACGITSPATLSTPRGGRPRTDRHRC